MASVALHREAAPDALWRLLVRLMSLDSLRDFRLVGGTALALQLGHRVSVDIDLFSVAPFEVSPVVESLRAQHDVRELEVAVNSIRGVADEVSVDIMSHQYPMIDAPVEREGIRMASLRDIAAMKLNAIANRGSKKDFWDFDALLEHFTHDQMLEFFAQKYTDENVWYVEKSLSYFDDAEADPSPRDLRDRSWDEVKENVSRSNRL